MNAPQNDLVAAPVWKFLMLAQAQEVFLQHSTTAEKKEGALVSKMAWGIKEFYDKVEHDLMPAEWNRLVLCKVTQKSAME